VAEKLNESLHPRSTLAEIFREFLRLGFVAYGGPASHIAMMEEHFVRRRSWVSRERFLDLVGAVNLLPGPSSTELAMYLGEIHGGLIGLILAGSCFILPAAVLVSVLAWAYLKFGTLPQVSGLLFGIKPVVVALIVQAIWNLGRTALKSTALALLAIAVFVTSAFGGPALILLIAAGLLCAVFRQARQWARGPSLSVEFLGWGAALAASPPGLLSLLLYFFKVGAVLFGSGYVLLAVLRADLVVHLHWLNDAQLLDAIAVSQATPGPFFTVATFIGYILAGWQGAALATVGMFLPAFLYVGITAGFLPNLRKSPFAGAFLDGVNAAAVALMAFVGWQFGRTALVNLPAILLALLSAVLVFRFKINSVWLVLGGALAGILYRALT
jgi:chromate transporter